MIYCYSIVISLNYNQILIMIINRKKNMKFDDVKNRLDDHIEHRNLRHSEQRYVILKTLWDANSKHLSAEEIYDRIKKEEDIGIATVYRALKLFKACNICRELRFNQNVSRYEIKYGKKHHDHLICINCGKFIEVMNKDIEELQDKIAEKNNFIIKSHKMELYGLCDECQQHSK